MHSRAEPPSDIVGNSGVDLVDADFHPSPASFEEFRDYFPKGVRDAHWVSHWASSRGAPIYAPPNRGSGTRLDATPPGGGPPASDPAFAEKELFEHLKVDYIVLIPITHAGMPDPEQEAALCSATNAWLADTWLSRHNGHGRYRGSICVAPGRPDLAAAEIERWKGHPYFVQVLMSPSTHQPLGQERFAPIHRAAAANGLPLALHVFQRTPGTALLTPTGHPSFYFEHHAQYPQIYMPHLVSFVMEGVFARLPELKLVLVEGGVSWLLPVMWRMDAVWDAYGAEVPTVTRRPSDYVKENVRLTTQPIEEPKDRALLVRYLEWMEAERLLLFSTDYPHWDFDDPRQVARWLPEAIRTRIFAQNAVELYRLPPRERQRPEQPELSNR